MDPIQEKYTNAFATAHDVSGAERPYLMSGCLYDQHGVKIDLSERYCDTVDAYQLNNPQTASCDKDAPELVGRSIYLGHLMKHYGHFLLETLSTFWALLEEEQYDYYVFHPFEGAESLPAFAVPIFQAFSIPVNKIHIIDRPVKFTEVDVPARLVKLNQSVDPHMRRVYARLVECSTPSYFGDSIYLSRVKNSQRKLGRSIINEPFIERLFRNAGFAVVYPEDYTVFQQISFIRSAKRIAGLSGTALHNVIFMSETAELLEIGDLRTGNEQLPMQVICNDLANVSSRFIPFKGHVVSWRFLLGLWDTSHLRNELPSLRVSSEPGGRGPVAVIASWVVAAARASFVALLAAARIVKKSMKGGR